MKCRGFRRDATTLIRYSCIPQATTRYEYRGKAQLRMTES
jgi:hypothetical protein